MEQAEKGSPQPDSYFGAPTDQGEPTLPGRFVTVAELPELNVASGLVLQPLLGNGGERVADVSVTPFDAARPARRLVVEVSDATQRQRISRETALLAQLGGSRLMVRQLAHEIKNPLGGLRGAAQLLERQLKGEAMREYTEVIIGEADRLAARCRETAGEFE